jgi:hypothetical protein
MAKRSDSEHEKTSYIPGMHVINLDIEAKLRVISLSSKSMKCSTLVSSPRHETASLIKHIARISGASRRNIDLRKELLISSHSEEPHNSDLGKKRRKKRKKNET